MIHGTHYLASSSDSFAEGKTWGPWLWYLNDGSQSDAASRWKREERAWPYEWFKDAAYQSRGSISGELVLSDGRPACGAAIFLGDSNSNISAADQGKDYYYTAYADEKGKFNIEDVRSGTYGLYAWSNGGEIGDVTTSFVQNNVIISARKKTNLKDSKWQVTDMKNRIFQIGAFDRKTDDFGLSGPSPFEHGRISRAPANLTYTIGKSQPSDWYFGQSALGTWGILFDLSSIPSSSNDAKLTVSLAGFSGGSSADILLNDVKVGNITTNSKLLVSSQDTYRGATRAGEWRLLEFEVAKAGLRVGMNRMDVRIKTSTQWRGWLWDSIVLEWV